MKIHLKLIFAVVALSLIVFTFFPGLHGDFEFDDQANLLQNEDIQIDSISLHNLSLAAFSGSSGPLGRPISMVTFALNHAFTGFDPYYLKLTNLTIHVFAAFCLYLLLTQLLLALQNKQRTQPDNNRFFWIACLGSLAWAVHPLNITSVLYVVQRMTSLSGLLSILALYFYVLGRNSILEGKPSGWWHIAFYSPFAGFIALFCKENAALLPLYIYLIEVFFFQFRLQRGNVSNAFRNAVTALIWVPITAVIVYLLLFPDWLIGGYNGRGFTLYERLLTESRVIWFYLHMIVMPDISLMGIYHDDIQLSTSLLNPVTTIISLIALLGLLVIAFGFRRRAPILSFGILWFLVGHVLESSIIALEIAHEHRNYFPMIGLIFAGMYYLLNLSVTKTTQNIAFFLAALLISLLSFSTHVRAQQWGNLLEHALAEVENHPRSPRAQQQLGRMYYKLYKAEPGKEFYEKAKQAFTISSALDKHFKGGLYARIVLDYNAGLTPPQSILDEFKLRLLSSRPEPGDVAIFESLLHCQLSGDCKLSDPIFIEFLEIEVTRYEGDPRRQASFLSFLGSYAAQKMDNEELAGKYLKQAVEIFPNDVQGRLNYAWYLEVTAQYEAAEKELLAARLVDTKHKYPKRINTAMKNLQARKRQVSSSE